MVRLVGLYLFAFLFCFVISFALGDDVLGIKVSSDDTALMSRAGGVLLGLLLLIFLTALVQHPPERIATNQRGPDKGGVRPGQPPGVSDR
jgi:hypothetical protein